VIGKITEIAGNEMTYTILKKVSAKSSSSDQSKSGNSGNAPDQSSNSNDSGNAGNTPDQSSSSNDSSNSGNASDQGSNGNDSNNSGNTSGQSKNGNSSSSSSSDTKGSNNDSGGMPGNAKRKQQKQIHFEKQIEHKQQKEGYDHVYLYKQVSNDDHSGWNRRNHFSGQQDHLFAFCQMAM